MRALTAIVVLALAGLAACPRTAAASGPFCFHMAPFDDVFVVFVDLTGGTQFAGSGRDIASEAATQVSGYRTGDTVRLAFTNSPDSLSGFPLLGGATIDLVTGTGTGLCHRVNSPEGCGTGTPITVTIVECPPDAATDAPAAGRPRKLG